MTRWMRPGKEQAFESDSRSYNHFTATQNRSEQYNELLHCNSGKHKKDKKRPNNEIVRFPLFQLMCPENSNGHAWVGYLKVPSC